MSSLRVRRPTLELSVPDITDYTEVLTGTGKEARAIIGGATSMRESADEAPTMFTSQNLATSGVLRG